MKADKIGRNDPCPCGSGKKYKKCCGVLADIIKGAEDPFDRYSQLITTVKIKLDQYYKQQIKKVRKEIKERFVTFTVDKNLAADHESMLSDWLWFDKTSSDENTLGFKYMEENADFMEKPLLECLSALNFSYLSVYEVQSYQELYLKVEDIFSHKHYQVLLKEPWDIDIDENPILLLGRLITLPDDHLFSGMVLMVKNKAGQKEFIKKHVEYVADLYDDELINLLKFNGETLYGVFDHACKKVLVNFRNIEVTAIDDILRASLLEQLEAHEGYTRLHQTDGFCWFKPAEDNRGYVRIAVGNEHVLACADVLEDITKLKELLTVMLPGKDSTVLSNRFLSQPPAIELADLWFTVVKDQETERWLATPHGELENKTPADLLQEENGKERLLELLEQFAQSTTGENELELITYMQNRINS